MGFRSTGAVARRQVQASNLARCTAPAFWSPAQTVLFLATRNESAYCTVGCSFFLFYTVFSTQKTLTSHCVVMTGHYLGTAGFCIAESTSAGVGAAEAHAAWHKVARHNG